MTPIELLRALLKLSSDSTLSDYDVVTIFYERLVQVEAELAVIEKINK